MPAQAADASAHANRPQWLNYQEGDFVITDYVFRTGETLPELKLHYRTLGTARRNTADTHGHFSHFYAELWKPYLIEFMQTLGAPLQAAAE